jgi:hypothetical protein
MVFLTGDENPMRRALAEPEMHGDFGDAPFGMIRGEAAEQIQGLGN